MDTSHSPFPDLDIPDTDLWSFLFERKDRQYPADKVLFTDVDSNRQYTYAEIRKLALNFGRVLRTQFDWIPGDVLCIFSSNSIDLPPIIWGTLAVGGVVCPINPNYKTNELLHPLKDSGAKVIVTERKQASTVLEAAKQSGINPDRVIIIDDEKNKIWERNPAKVNDVPVFIPPVKNPSATLAYLVYSSGTTGLPKAVMISHRNMVANILQSTWIDQGLFSWRRGDRALALLPFFHIYGLNYLLNHTVHLGLSTFIMPRFNFESFCSTIEKNKITYAYVVPPIVLELVRNPDTAKYDLSSLRLMMSAAAPLSAELVNALIRKMDIPVRQAYGMTECCPCTHSQTASEARTHIGTVGRVLPNMTVKYAPVSGETSSKSKEIWVKGPNVFMGYWNNPTANTDSFSPDGFYKTGDVGYADSDGYLYITDRVKELIKYNGFQIAPAELEAIIIGHPAVSDVAVVGVPNGQDGSELPRAYVVVNEGHLGDDITAADIMQYVSGQVVGYKKLRGGVRFVEAIPRNPTGKILRRELKGRKEAKL